MTIATSHYYRTIETVHLWRAMYIWHAPTHQRTHALRPVLDHQDPCQPFHNDIFGYHYMAVQTVTTASFDFLHNTQHLDYIMNATDYWPYAGEYSIWNTTVASLQFWTADLEPHVLSSTIEQVYNAFFYTISTHLLCQQYEDVLFGHFVTILNAAFESKHLLEDEGYESGSENFNIPTPLRWTPRIHHISSDENISFDPSTPHTTATCQSHCKPVCCQLLFSSSDNEESISHSI